MYRVLISGTRKNLDTLMQDRVKFCLGYVAYKLCPEGGTLINGNADGVDTYGAWYWRSLGDQFTSEEFRYPGEMGKAGGPFRNQKMVDSGANIGLFFPLPESVGTFDCLRKAKAAGIPCFELPNSWKALQFFQSKVDEMALTAPVEA